MDRPCPLTIYWQLGPYLAHRPKGPPKFSPLQARLEMARPMCTPRWWKLTTFCTIYLSYLAVDTLAIHSIIQAIIQIGTTITSSISLYILESHPI